MSFGSKKVEQTPDKEAWQLSSGKAISDWAQKYLASYQPGAEYGGDLTAKKIAPGEAAGQDWLMKFINQPATGENYGLAADEIKKTLTGGYDPYTSPFYQATREGAMREQQDAIDAQKRGQGYRGTFFQSTGLGEERKLREGTTNYLNQILGKMSEQERQNRLSAVSPAMELEKYATGAPLAKASAGMTLGSLPRLIEQGDLEARYKDFLRKQEELSGTLGAAQGVFGTGMNYGVKSWETPSPFERIMNSVAPIAGSVLSAYAGNPFGAFGMMGGPKTTTPG